ncbi:hypothetical protein 162322466 [Organic Lake phycodnavirus 1]|jgi:hypothetical protein|nr:hypothetical protein 162322466 [Organic Lake phycodnavirus 1]
MDDSQRLKLQEMIHTNQTSDNTEEIRTLKHSKQIRSDVMKIQQMKHKMKTTHFKTLDNALQKECFFLFKNYTIIYNKLLKNDLDIKILYQFLDVLESVENGENDQHEASYTIGMLLKKIYVDKKLEEITPSRKLSSETNISWKEYYANKKLI